MLHDAHASKVVGQATCTFVFHPISICGQREDDVDVDVFVSGRAPPM
jgi:hypothetical protein